MPAHLEKVPFTAVVITGGIWKTLMDSNRNATLPIQHSQLQKTGRLDALKLKERKGCGQPHIFWDSDVAKWIEAAAYSLASHPDKSLEKKVDRVILDIEKTQAPDGYFNSHYQTFPKKKRWSNLRDNHELYCAGHLMEAAAAYYQATGKRRFLDVMMRYADLIDSLFGPEKGKMQGYSGHQEIELALIKLYEVTDEKRYLNLATFFINERGQSGRGKPLYFDQEAIDRGDEEGSYEFGTHEYSQSHMPVREQTEVVGHAVRAMYLYSGMADIAAYTKDTSLLKACKNLWKGLHSKRIAVTGGLGPRAGNEGMTVDYDLPAEGAYLETCAAVGLVFWSHRLFLATGDATYLDTMERALYNGTISGVDPSGSEFFYGNPLASHPRFDGNDNYRVRKTYHYRREGWFGCACCPPNLARMIAQFPGYMHAVKNKTVFVALYADATSQIAVGKTNVTLTQTTDYPWNGKVTIKVNPDSEESWTLALRNPGWCQKVTVKVNGKKVQQKQSKGFILIKREWKKGDKVQLDMEMPVEQIAVHPLARQVVGKVALQRGPVVYCLEEVDNSQGLANTYVNDKTRFKISTGPASLGKVPVLTAKASMQDMAAWKDDLYRTDKNKMVKREIVAVPYFLWGNRKPGEMTVFMNTR
ncbi:MAG: glycoside hydrolase family 127 protein [Lentisphaeria bacterium]|nr:glycoside hydrolase family 127 protein [Lentisphaeria bacterium]NQZ66887.1 glycoside hydrolase family 127 protein [Lentisphaeria bacterium]